MNKPTPYSGFSILYLLHLLLYKWHEMQREFFPEWNVGNFQYPEAGCLFVYTGSGHNTGAGNESGPKVNVFFLRAHDSRKRRDEGGDSLKITLASNLTSIQAEDYYPFGGSFNSWARTYSEPNRFLYQGKELQEEIDVYDFGARVYDQWTVRTWQLDPRADLFYEYSPYTWALGNPISIIDPSGMIAFPGDFYGENGKKIGTDGIDDGKVYVVADKKEAKAIAKTDKAGGTTQVGEVSSAVELPSANVREQMGKAVDRSNAPNESVGDTKGGFHEEGGIYGKTNGQEKVIAAQPGQAADPSKVDHAEVDVFSGETATNYLEEVEGTFHVHPSGEVKTGGGANTIGGEKTHSFDQSPSPQDFDAAKSNGRTGNNYVLGAKGTVTIYNKDGTRATFPLKQFRSIGIKKK